MSDETRDLNDLPEELAELQAALDGLTPVKVSLSRDRLMYEAGWNAAQSSTPWRVVNKNTKTHDSESRATLGRATIAWPIAAMSTLATVVLAVLLVIGRQPQVVERIVYVDRAASDTVTDVEPNTPENPPPAPRENPRRLASFSIHTDTSPYNYLALRDRVLWHGVDALPTTPLPTGTSIALPPPKTRRELLQELLPPQPTAKPLPSALGPNSDTTQFNLPVDRTA